MDADVRRLLKWVLILTFFAVVPPLFLEVAGQAMRALARGGDHGNAALSFAADIPVILLAYWAGTMGSVLSYLYDRLNGKVQSEDMLVAMARFLFGGVIGAASCIFIRSGMLLKLFYPKLPAMPAEDLVDYQPAVAFAVICGLLGPSLIKGVRKRAGG